MMAKKSKLKTVIFIISLALFLFMYGASWLYQWIWHNPVPLQMLDQSGDSAPFSPFEYPPFGTDPAGNSFFAKILIGFKYTISLALIITCLRVLISTVLGLLAGTYIRDVQNKLNPVIKGYNVIPASLFLYYVFTSLAFSHNTNLQQGTIISLEIILLTVVAIPADTYTIASETNRLFQESFVEPSMTLGAGKWRLVRKHFRQYLIPEISLVFFREIVQVLVLLAHLGVLNRYFQGAFKVKLFQYELTETLGHNWHYILSDWWWLSLIPILCMTLLIILLQNIGKGFERMIEVKYLKKQPLIDSQEIDYAEEDGQESNRDLI